MPVEAVALNNVSKMNINRKPKSDMEMSYQRAVGRMLTKARMDHDMEVEQLAELLRGLYPLDVGFNRTSLYKHEKGDRTLTPYRLSCIAQALNLPISHLFDVDTRNNEVENIYGNIDILSPSNFKNIRKGDGLVTKAINFDNVEDLILKGHYVGIDKDGAAHLYYIMPSDNPNKFAVEWVDGIVIMDFSDILTKAKKFSAFYRVTYSISPVNQVT